MKSSLKKFAVGVLSLTVATLTQATEIIHIVGSNGDRQATQSAIGHLLGAEGTWTFQGVNGYATGTGGSATVSATATGSNYGVWNGTYNSTPVIIKVSFIGAAGAVAAVAGSLDAPFVQPEAPANTGNLPDPTTGAHDTAVPDFGFSTNFQATTPFNGDYLGHTYVSLDETPVGISALQYVASPGFPAGANLTTQVAQQLYLAGAVPLSLITGNSADENKIVYALGRNSDAGQRLASYAEFGLGANATVQVWFPTTNPAPNPITANTPTATPTGQVAAAGSVPKYGGTVENIALWPIQTVSGVNSGSLGNGGFTTGADLAPYLTTVLAPAAYKKRSSSAVGGYFIGYVTPGDYLSRIVKDGIPEANRGVPLKWNGVDYSESNLKNGTYTAWLYNRIIKRTGELEDGSLKAQFFASLRDQILQTDATQGGGLKIDENVRVERYTDGGNVFPLY
ncbi:hypothetical protein TSACC_13 [Terrimicrobium sacchariphilum]|uniref:Uncharacterized protein n=1 Tax=Terrimicrobium sacchariphilum TaxID=690879 RepID=A0A146G0N7_TERSA|nr:hypothetical protein [Terrimicrobium sacchariphilum]GAT31455.1 hypothetical protein TSACC_13 [Terrimicrobium sacchariphilum]